MIDVSVHKFINPNSDSTVQSIKFNSPLGFASWLDAAKRFFSKEVETGAALMIHITIGIGEEDWEIHFDRIRGVARVSEFNVTLTQDDCEMAGMI